MPTAASWRGPSTGTDSSATPPPPSSPPRALQNSDLDLLDDAFDGVADSSVARGGLAWTAGVRAGNVLAATSATLGSKLWPKSTLDSVRLAISSRKVMSATVDFKLRRLAAEGEDEAAREAVEEFELALLRPIGVNAEGES